MTDELQPNQRPVLDMRGRHGRVQLKGDEFQIGQAINSLPSHRMCSGSAGGTVEQIIASGVAKVRCNGCNDLVEVKG